MTFPVIGQHAGVSGSVNFVLQTSEMSSSCVYFVTKRMTIQNHSFSASQESDTELSVLSISASVMSKNALEFE